ncbi:MAG: hypothetical protein J6W99_00300 [Bacteroidaceae bacterium]|nr:hypothetical protein [Bacteroidaceae bacterium]
MINRSSLYYIASVIWGIPGVIITVKGISAYFSADKGQLWWLLLITALVQTGFIFMFSRIVAKYRKLIREQPERTSPFKTFPVRGWVIVVFMMCLGMVLKIIGVPVVFTASFYSGLGPSLITAAILFLRK